MKTNAENLEMGLIGMSDLQDLKSCKNEKKWSPYE